MRPGSVSELWLPGAARSTLSPEFIYSNLCDAWLHTLWAQNETFITMFGIYHDFIRLFSQYFGSKSESSITNEIQSLTDGNR